MIVTLTRLTALFLCAAFAGAVGFTLEGQFAAAVACLLWAFTCGVAMLALWQWDETHVSRDDWIQRCRKLEGEDVGITHRARDYMIDPDDPETIPHFLRRQAE